MHTMMLYLKRRWPTLARVGLVDVGRPFPPSPSNQPTTAKSAFASARLVVACCQGPRFGLLL